MQRVFGILLCCLVPQVATADDTHYHDYPVGGRAVGLGGAFVALGSDPSGMFYNPAGLVDAKYSSVQLNTNLYGLEIADSFFSAVGRAANPDTIFTNLNIIPSSASFTSVLLADADGRARTSYGLGAFVPSFRNLNVESSSVLEEQTAAGCNSIAYQRSLLDRTIYAGGSIGHRLDEKLRFGFSGFIAYRTLRDLEQTACFGPASDNGTAFASAETNVRLTVASLLLTFGVQYDVTPRLTLGLTVSAPSILLFDFADVRVRQEFANPSTGASRFLLESLTSLPARSTLATSVRGGAAYVIPDIVTFSADLSFFAPTRYTLFDVPAERQDVAAALTTVTNIERNAVVNLNLGAEYLVAKWFSVAGGFFTNFSSAPSIPGDTGARFDSDRLPKVHAFGGSAILGFFSEYTLTRVGLTMSYGSGTDVVPRVQGLSSIGEPPEYVKAELSQLFVFLFISSTFRY